MFWVKKATWLRLGNDRVHRKEKPALILVGNRMPTALSRVKIPGFIEPTINPDLLSSVALSQDYATVLLALFDAKVINCHMKFLSGKHPVRSF